MVVLAAGLFGASSHAQQQVQSHRSARPAGGNPPAESVLYSFCATGGEYCTDGAFPMGQLVQAADGNYYGVTQQGGENGQVYNGYGSVFKLTPSGTMTTIYSFCEQSDCSDGLYPEAGLVQGSDGNFYGVANQGGASIGFGTVYKVTPAGAFTLLYSFTNVADGAYPVGALVQGDDGNFYGTTTSGGASGPGGSGTIFQVTPAGKFTTIHSFCSQTDCTDGATPAGGLLEGSDGNFYGTTQSGGTDSSGCDGYGCGTIYRVTKAGALTTLYSFQDGADGAGPETGLVEASDGSYYGSTLSGGTPSDGCLEYGCGTAFQLKGSALNTLYSFTGAADGGASNGRLVLASDGNFYGTTGYFTVGTDNNSGGTVFEMTPSGGLTTLYTFCAQTNCTDGDVPSGGVTQGSDGNFYGVTTYGGANDVSNGGGGTAFKVALTPALAPPVKLTVSTQPYQNRPVTVAFTVANAFSLTSQQCYAFATDESAAKLYALGKVTGKLSGNVYSGTFTVTPPTAATYLGALTCGGVETGYVSGTVAPTHATTLVLTATPNPVFGGTTVALAATATRTDNSGTPTGTVSFYYGTYFLGSATLNSGVATLSAASSIAPVGNYAIDAVYAGDTQDGGSTSNTVTVESEKGTTSTALAAMPNPVSEGQPVTLTATVTTNGGTVAGTVTFASGTHVLGTVNVNGGVAQLSASSGGVPPGNYAVTATYNGSSRQSVSTSTPVTVTVTAAN